jgi:hypothetical protein
MGKGTAAAPRDAAQVLRFPAAQVRDRAEADFRRKVISHLVRNQVERQK